MVEWMCLHIVNASRTAISVLVYWILIKYMIMSSAANDESGGACHGSGWGIWGSEGMGLSSINDTLLFDFLPRFIVFAWNICFSTGCLGLGYSFDWSSYFSLYVTIRSPAKRVARSLNSLL
jgi:hypothetical protein